MKSMLNGTILLQSTPQNSHSLECLTLTRLSALHLTESFSSPAIHITDTTFSTLKLSEIRPDPEHTISMCALVTRQLIRPTDITATLHAFTISLLERLHNSALRMLPAMLISSNMLLLTLHPLLKVLPQSV